MFALVVRLMNENCERPSMLVLMSYLIIIGHICLINYQLSDSGTWGLRGFKKINLFRTGRLDSNNHKETPYIRSISSLGYMTKSPVKLVLVVISYPKEKLFLGVSVGHEILSWASCIKLHFMHLSRRVLSADPSFRIVETSFFQGPKTRR